MAAKAKKTTTAAVKAAAVEVSEFARWANTAAQREILKAWEACGRNQAAAARELGLSRSTVQSTLTRIRNRAARSGYAPDYDQRQAVPEGYLAKGVSTLYDEEGKVRLQWVKSAIDHERQQALMEAAASAMAEELAPRPVIAKASRAKTERDLINFYPVTDAHLGMLAWGEECGEDWDLKTGAQTIVEGFARMVREAPRARRAVIAQMGDFLHWDSLEAVTPMSKHLLDADTRAPKMVKVAVWVLETVIEEALKRHDEVELIIAEGNHDLFSSVFLRVMFGRLYRQNRRLRIVESQLPYYVTSCGGVMLGVHHGHLKGIGGKSGSDLALIFADTEAWKSTEHRFIHTGHKHQAASTEVHGAMLVQHPTIAARDAYAARHGWKSMRRMTATTYHARWGEYQQTVITPGRIVGK